MIFHRMKCWLLLVCLSFCVATNVSAEKLVWDASSGQVDGYKIHYSQSSGNYPNTIDVGNVTEYSLDLLSLAEKTTYYFVVTAYNTAGESAYSNAVSFTPGDTTPPLPPIGLQAD